MRRRTALLFIFFCAATRPGSSRLSRTPPGEVQLLLSRTASTPPPTNRGVNGMSEERRNSGLQSLAESDSDTFETVIPITICILSEEDFLDDDDDDDGGHESSFDVEQSDPHQKSLTHDHTGWEYVIGQKCIKTGSQQEAESSDSNNKQLKYNANKPLKRIHKDASQNGLMEQKELGSSDMGVSSPYFLSEKTHIPHRNEQTSLQAMREHQTDYESVGHDFSGQCFNKEDAAALDLGNKKNYRSKAYSASYRNQCLEHQSNVDDLKVSKGLEHFKISSASVTSSISSSDAKQPLINVGRFAECREEEISTLPLIYEQRQAHMQDQDNSPMLCNTKEKQIYLKEKYEKEKETSIHSKSKVFDPFAAKLNSIRTPMKPGNFKCKLCSATFQYAEHRRNHMNLEHKINKMYVCSCCQKHYSLLIDLRYHLKAHKKAVKLENKRQRRKRRKKGCKTLQDKEVREDPFSIMEPYGEVDKVPKILSCKTCLFSSQSIPLFVAHTKGHKGTMQYLCPLCDYSADLPSYLLNHMYWHTGQTLYKCTYCPFITKYLHSMKKHSLIHTKKPHPCNVCDLAFISVTGLQRHMNTHAVGNSGNSKRSGKIHACDQCGMAFYSELHLSCHTCMHLEATQCDVKLAGVSMDGDKVTQTNSHHSNIFSPKNYKCQLCNYTTPYFHNLRQHFRVHTGEKPYKCKLCEKLFRTASHLHRHKFVHLKVRTGKQNQCSNFSNTVPDPEVHQPTHQGNSSKPSEYAFKCRKCSYSASSKKKLQKHKRSHSVSESTKFLPSKESLPKLFQCELCTYITSISGNLKVHRRIHTGEKPYQCKHCDKAFRTSHHLQRHKNVHVAKERARDQKTIPIKMYTCVECKYTTLHSGNYKQHLRIHTGEKPYKCDQCDLAFRTSGHHRRHVLRHWKSGRKQRP